MRKDHPGYARPGIQGDNPCRKGYRKGCAYAGKTKGIPVAKTKEQACGDER